MKKTSYCRRWAEPTASRELRDEYRQLRRELKGSRTSKPRRLEVEARLDEIASTSLLASGTPIELPPAKPTTVDLLALCDRVDEAKRRGSLSGKSIPLAGTPAGLEAFLANLVGDGREGAIRGAKAAPDSERAAALLNESELAQHPLNVLAREIAQWLWTEDRSAPKPDVKQIAAWTVKSWLEKRPYNRADLRGKTETVTAAVDDAYRLLAERDAEDPIWFVRRAEKLFDAAGLDPAKPQAAEPAVNPVPLSAPAPEATPEIKAQTALVPQVNLILQIDSQHLGRLATHSPEFDSGIRAGITRQLQACGHCDGVFLANLYNAMRPKGLSAFPPRSL